MSSLAPVTTISEISLRWFKENPDLGVESLVKFYTDHPPEKWNVRARQNRTGFFELVASRKQMEIA
jgi:hypothetical protein